MIALLAVTLPVMQSCGGGASGAGSGHDGLYIGTDVTFRVVGGVAQDFRFSHIECRIPSPVNPAVAACLSKPVGQPAGTLALTGATLEGTVGELFIDGEIDGVAATGTWTYAATCFDGSTCESDGEWTAERTIETGGSEPVNGSGGSNTQPPGGGGTTVGAPGSGDTGDEEDPERAAPGTPSSEASGLQLTAWEAFEQVRQQAGLAMPGQSDLINAAAQAHADYFAIHVDSYYESGLNPHLENPDWEEGFTGTDIGDRLSYQGVTGGFGWGEVMAFSGSPQGAVDGWMDTLYHRIPFVHPNTQDWGFGIATGGTKCEVMDYLSGAAVAQGASTWETAGQLGVPWPPPGSVDVDTQWGGNESPQPPLPASESYPSGPVITLTFVSGTSLELFTATLTDPSGVVPAQVQSPDNDAYLSTTWALYAYDPLSPNTAHTVQIQGEVNGEPYEATWTFMTR